MAKAIHKGTELNNIKETWAANENGAKDGSVPAGNALDERIKREAEEYDEANKEERVLGGDRASVKDEGGGQGS